jgi:DNA-binding MarR family transcriptional regulator
MILNHPAKIMKALYWAGGEMTVPQLIKDTGLKQSQVYGAIYVLEKKNYIKKRLEEEYGYRTIKRKIFVELRNPVLAEQSLKKWGAL